MKEEEGNARFGHDSFELPTSTTFAVLGDSPAPGNKRTPHLDLKLMFCHIPAV